MSQKLILPLNHLYVTAGYKNLEYLKYRRMQHYGIDCTSIDRTIYACGNGVVVACGQDGRDRTGEHSRLGLVTVIIYYDVQFNNGYCCDLTARIYHMDRIFVKVGESVCKGQKIGIYGNTGKDTTGPHLHIEFDTDTRFPTLAYGVTVNPSARIVNTPQEYARAGYILVDSTVDPAHVWFCGEEQTIQCASSSWSIPEDLEVPLLP